MCWTVDLSNAWGAEAAMIAVLGPVVKSSRALPPE
jgi:hypothetical protein